MEVSVNKRERCALQVREIDNQTYQPMQLLGKCNADFFTHIIGRNFVWLYVLEISDWLKQSLLLPFL